MNAYGEVARWPTDCEHCVFVGRDGPFDIHRCSASLVTGLVWRYGPGPDYTTVPNALHALRVTCDESRNAVILAKIWEFADGLPHVRGADAVVHRIARELRALFFN